jgi:hypothetical protein
MPSPDHIQLLGLLGEALASPLGIAVETSDPEKLRQRLYPVRKSEPEFACLAFERSPLSSTELWIVKHERAKAD